MAQVDDLERMIAEAECMVAFTGAGISTESGIPDYRSPGGIWTKFRPIDFGDFMASAEARRETWRRKFASHETLSKATPNAGHRALARLVEKGKMAAVVTQNIDGLHQAAGSKLVLELHGTIREAACLSCGHRTPMQEQLDRVRAGDPDPACVECGGIQKSATIAFGQQLDTTVLQEAFAASSACDLLLAVGTSLTVQPASLLASQARHEGARLVIVNQGETSLDDLADAKLRGPIGEILPRLVTVGG